VNELLTQHILASLICYSEMLKERMKASQRSWYSCFYVRSVRLGPKCLCRKSTTFLYNCTI